jgi:DNA-binding protein H-NS
MSSYKDLVRQKEELERQIEAANRSEKADAVAKVHALMSEHGLTVEDLSSSGRKKSAPRSVSKIAPKYRDPATGKTWTGRGKAPRWLDGQNRDKFLIA